MTPPEALQDSEPEPWKAEKRPDPTACERALILAAKRFAEVDAVLVGWERPRSGSAYAALLECWRSRRTELLEAGMRYPASGAGDNDNGAAR